MNITSIEALDNAVAESCRIKTTLAADKAAMETAIARIHKHHSARQASYTELIAEIETDIQDYCQANRATLFVTRKSRETASATFGFEYTPHRVEPTSRKIKWADIVKRLLKLPWGKAYINTPEPKPDKNALLADREKLTPEQLTAAGIQFCQDEQFFIRPKSEVADPTVQTTT